jgi:hypothetical protein
MTQAIRDYITNDLLSDFSEKSCAKYTGNKNQDTNRVLSLRSDLINEFIRKVTDYLSSRYPNFNRMNQNELV